MVKKFVKGSSTNPEGVIKALENLGGVNNSNLVGSDEEGYYFINNNNVIECMSRRDSYAGFITECFEEIQPVESAPKVITNLDVAKWYFTMINECHAIQFLDHNADIQNFPKGYSHDDDLIHYTHVRIDFDEWIPIEEAGII